MSNLQERLLESWDRQCQIVLRLAAWVKPENLELRVGTDEFDVAQHLSHIHQVRRYWLANVSPDHGRDIPRSFAGKESPWEGTYDMAEVVACLKISGEKVREATQVLLDAGVQSVGGYDHPVFFLQHMLWHDGWHVGAILLALRKGGAEPDELWEEENIWGMWRTE